MKEMTITYQEKDYQVKEPTIEMWSRLSAWKDLLEEKDFVIKLISEATSLKDADILKADWFDIMNVGSALTDYLVNQSSDFINEFEFRGQKYRFIDLPNLSFGEFIDIDSVLSKDEHDRKTSLHLLMAMLYREVDTNNNLVGYDASKVQARAELFKQLPVKYVHGSMSFFLRLERILQKPSLRFLVKSKYLKVKKKLKKQMKKISVNIGDGLVSLRRLPIKILQRWGILPNTH